MASGFGLGRDVRLLVQHEALDDCWGVIRSALQEWVSPERPEPQARSVSVVGQELYDPNVKKVTFRADQARDLLTKAACARLGLTLLASDRCCAFLSARDDPA